MKNVLKALKSRNINGYIVKNITEAKKKALSLIPKEAIISWGGSLTLKEVGIIDELKSKGYKCIDRDIPQMSPTMKQFVMKYGSLQGIYLSGTNAITEDGKLVNIDGWGNRVNAIAYGPEKVIIIAGKNKIVKNTEDALNRIAKVAAPLNTKKLSKKTPCAKMDECQDCRSPERICNIVSIVQFQNNPERIHVIIVNEDLGY